MNCIFLLDYTFQKNNGRLNPTEEKNTFIVGSCLQRRKQALAQSQAFPKHTHTK